MIATGKPHSRVVLVLSGQRASIYHQHHGGLLNSQVHLDRVLKCTELKQMPSVLPTSWQITTSIKKADLQHIALLVGAHITGTKAEILDSIRTVVRDPATIQLSAQKSKDEVRLLSIDMGIRNLAFAFLRCPMTASKTKGRVDIGKPILCEWQRVDLTLSQAAPTVKRLRLESSIAAETTGIFEPQALAKHAYSFAKFCADHQPTHILIEKQRFRSGGHSAVQEWTLRVGMLEAMLHATFRTLTEEGVMRNTTVSPILPMRVNKYWFRDVEVPATGSKAKLAKIALVRAMLNDVDKDRPFAFDRLAAVDLGAFIAPLRSGRTVTGKRGQIKLDDMSDSLLQALAWLDWQRHIQNIQVED